MLYKIIGDSCMDLTEELKLDPHFQMIPLTLQIGDYKVTDDETFNQKEFLAGSLSDRTPSEWRESGFTENRGWEIPEHVASDAGNTAGTDQLQ